MSTEREFIDILDENGNKTGAVKDIMEVHRDGDWHRVVFVYVMNSDGEILLQKRSKKMFIYPNTWDMSAAGHISSNEESEDSARKELFEETGLKTDNLKYLFTITQKMRLNDGKILNNEFCDAYITVTDNFDSLATDGVEVAAFKFVKIDDLKKMVADNDPNLVPHRESYEKLFEYLKNNLDKK